MLFNLKNELNGFPGKLPPFDPSLAPGNVAIYDGDVNCDAASWEDTAGGNSITFFNAPTYNAAGLNGHGTITFDGISQYGQSVTPNIVVPSTIYLVTNLITWVSASTIIDDGTIFNNNRLRCVAPNPNLQYLQSVNSNPDVVVNTFNVISLVKNINVVSIKTNLDSPIVGVKVPSNNNGIQLGAAVNPINFGNCSHAYIIMRNVADPNWLQNNFVNWLKNRFAI